jgi:hypothetical protein
MRFGLSMKVRVSSVLIANRADDTWREFFVLAVLASMAFIVFWALLVFVFVLFG